MFYSSLIALALSTAALAAPATTPFYKSCEIVTSPWTHRFGRTEFAAVDSSLFFNSLKIVDDNGVLVTQTTAFFNSDPETFPKTPGVGLLFVPAATTKQKRSRVAISYTAQAPNEIIYVRTLKGEICLVPDSASWKSVETILNAQKKGHSLADCELSTMQASERYSNPNTEISFSESTDKAFWESSNSMSTDVKSKVSALTIRMHKHLGVFIQQDPAYDQISKIEIEYVNIKGDIHRSFAFANKTIDPMEDGQINANVYSMGYCKVPGSETWSKIKAVNLVV